MASGRLVVPVPHGIDHGPGTMGHAEIEELEDTQQNHELKQYLLETRIGVERLNRQLYDHSHPVDEYVSTPGVPAGLQIEVIPTYEVPEHIRRIVIATPDNASGLVLQLGSDRTLPIPSGLVDINFDGVLTRTDRRLLNATSWGGGPIYFGLTGYASSDFGTV